MARLTAALLLLALVAPAAASPLIPVRILGAISWRTGWNVGSEVIPAMKMAVDEINADPNLLPNHDLQWAWDETACNRNTAMRSVMRMQQDYGVDALIGPPCSTAALPIGLMANVWNMPMVSWAAGSPELSNKDDYPMFVRTVGNYVGYAKPFANFIREGLQTSRVNILAARTGLWTPVSNEFNEIFKAENISVDVFKQYESVTPSTVGATDAWMPELLERRARVNVLLGLCKDIRQVMLSAKDLGMVSTAGWEFIVLEADPYCHVAATEFNDSDRDDPEPFRNIITANWRAAGNATRRAEFLAQLESRRNNSRGYRPPPFGSFAPDGNALRNQIIADRIASDGWATEDWLISELYGSAWSYTFDYAQTLYDAVYLYARGLHRHLSANPSNTHHQGAEVVAAMKQTVFEGISRTIVLNEKGDLEPDVDFNLLRLNRDDPANLFLEPTNVYYYTASTRVGTSVSTIFFPDGTNQGTTVIPVAARPIDTTIPDKTYELLAVAAGTRLAMSVFAVIAMTMCLAALGMNLYFRNHKYIKYSSPNVNCVIIVGCILCCASTFVLQDSCMGFLWLATLGFSMAFGALASKTWRVHKLFNNKKLARVSIKDWELFVVILVVLSFDIILLLVWQVGFPMVKATQNYPPVTDRPSTYDEATETWSAGHEIHRSKQACTSPYDRELTLVLYGSKFMLVVFTAFLAWETRSVQIAALNDSKVIGFAVYNIMLLCLIIVGAGEALADNPESQYAFQAGGTIVCVIVTISMVFGSKAYALATGMADEYAKNKSSTTSGGTSTSGATRTNRGAADTSA